MPVAVACPCGNEYELKDEFEGKLVKCPNCNAVARAREASPKSKPQVEALFERDLFLLRQKALAINEFYTVADQMGEPLFYVERPRHLIQNLFAAIVGFGAGAMVFWMFELATMYLRDTALGMVAILAAPIAFLVTWIGVTTLLSKKRHITFYRDAEKTSRAMHVTQDTKLQLLSATYTLHNHSGVVLARYRKNYLYNLIRKRWVVEGPAGKLIITAKEDSIILSLLRRWLGPLFGFLRTNFVFVAPGGAVIGEFKRNFTILDRYVLDLQADAKCKLDRRIGLALGVLLDTGERR